MYSVEIRSKEKLFDVSETLYGLFFEDINRAGDGGLYAELLRNRAFDEGVLPEGCKYDPQEKVILSPTGWRSSFDCWEQEGIVGWETRGGAEICLTEKDTLNSNRRRALQVHFHGGELLNSGFWGIPLEKGSQYRFYMFAKSDTPVSVRVSLASEKGERYAEHTFTVAGDYTKYECMFTSDAADHSARLVLSSREDCNVLLGFTSLFPKDTFMGRENGLRRSLAERLLALKPAFLRFPGGCIVEGFTKETAYRFRDTIGPVWERKPHWLLWSYMTTNGLGFHEYLQFCEDAGIDAMYVFNCGMTCQGRCPDYFEEDLIREFYEDTVQAILYATAPADTEWGRRRAENGHPDPFHVLKYIEIGNENWGVQYDTRYRFFYEKLKEQFPQLHYISTDHTERAGLKTEMVDEHFYSSPVFFAANTGMYDSLDRDGVDIYCGEYASTIGCKEGTLYGALGEAAFLTGIERNQDKVKMTSYAPLFQNVNHVSWEPDLIVFNNHVDYGIPSYHLLKMFAENRGSYVCGHNIVTESSRRRESGCFRGMDNVCVQGDRFTTVWEGDSLHIRFWDKGTDGEDQDHYDWIAENGRSQVVHFNGWSRETICEKIPCRLSQRNTAEIITDRDSFQIILNGVLLHSRTLEPLPHLTGVCTVDSASGEIITKLVNFSDKAIPVRISCDRETEDCADITVLTGESLDARNSFENPEAVSPFAERIEIPADHTLQIRPRSINVIRQKIRK